MPITMSTLPCTRSAKTSSAITRPDPVREQLDPQRTITHQRGRIRNRQVTEQMGDTGVVLPSKNLGWSHQRALEPALHRRQQRMHRHEGLA